MATILLATSGVPGMLYPSIELARRLAAAGHRPIHATAEEHRGLVERQGLSFVPLPPSRLDEVEAAEAKTGLVHRWRHRHTRRAEALSALGVEGFRDTIRSSGADLLLLDGELHEHVIVAAGAGIPLTLLNCFASIWRRPGLPPAHGAIRPGVGWRGSKVGMWLAWRALDLGKLRRRWVQRLRRGGCDRRSLLEALGRQHGFDVRRETDPRQWLMPFTYRRFPVLSLHSLAFEFPHEPPRHVCYVGPMVLEDRGDEARRGDSQARLDRLFARRQRDGRRLVYAAFGSYFSTDLDLIRRLVDAVATRPDWDLVISLGGRFEPSDLGAVPANVHAYRWIAQLTVLAHADAAVVHGGINTIDECVLAAVPMLVYCGGETDMAGNTARIVHHGIGQAGDRRRDTPEVMRDRLDQLLHRAPYRERLAVLRQRYAEDIDGRLAEQAVEAMLAASPGGGS